MLVRVWLAAILAFGAGQALAEPAAVPLQLAPVSNLVSPPPASAEAVKPAFKDKNFPLREAVNLKEIYELIGPLSPAQEKFLEENRFLLLTKPSFLMSQTGEQPPADEMLANFDRLGGALAPARRAPQNARFVGPDIVLHAWNKYLETRLAAAEAGPLRESLSALLAGLYDNAAALRAEAERPAAANWERLMAQLAVARILVETGDDEPDSEAPVGPLVSAQDQALANFERYRPAFSETLARKIRAELGRIYQGEGTEPSQLGLTPAGGEALVDYAWFAPPAGSPDAASWRAYFRAQVWLGRLGWDGRTETGLADALNWALAMSRSRLVGGGEEAGGGDHLPAAWARLTAITAFLSGYADFPGYREWLPFLMKEAGVSEFTADTSSDREVLARLKAAGPWPPVSDSFRELRLTAGRTVVCLLPVRHSLPELIEAGLISPGSRSRPELYSGLWPPVLLGHEGAQSLVERQVALTRPLAGSGGADKPSDPPATTALAARLAQLSAHLKAEPESSWFTSLLAAEWRLLACLTDPGASGYPLYLQSPAYPAKNLETITGLLTEAGHRGLWPLPEEPARPPEPAPPAQGEAPAALVRGLIEPNPAFWREMVRTVAHTAAVFREYGLFPDDVADNGALRRFLRRLERCAELAERELAGTALTDDDYEFIRLFTLDWMALPPGDGGGLKPEDRLRSGLVTEAQVLPPRGDQPGLVLYQATAEPWLMLVMTANDLTPRLTLGLAYSHYEFAGPYDRRLTDDIWREAAYGRYQNQPPGAQSELPARNFWYDPLRP